MAGVSVGIAITDGLSATRKLSRNVSAVSEALELDAAGIDRPANRSQLRWVVPSAKIGARGEERDL